MELRAPVVPVLRAQLPRSGECLRRKSSGFSLSFKKNLGTPAVTQNEDIPDWRNERAYEALTNAEKPAFAWEWLRRHDDYRMAAFRWLGKRWRDRGRLAEEQHEAAKWGLHHFEDPRLFAPEARPVWHLRVHPFVLEAEAQRSGLERDMLNIGDFPDLVSLVRGRGAEHILFSDGRHSIRLDVTGPSIIDGPVFLRYRIGGAKTSYASFLVLQRFLALVRSGRFSSTLHHRDTKARRHILQLRAFDALCEGANQRTIAFELLDKDAGKARWRIEDPSLRSRVQRLVNDGRRSFSGSYLSFLK